MVLDLHTFCLFEKSCRLHDYKGLHSKALQNWKISVKALPKWLQKLTIIRKQ